MDRRGGKHDTEGTKKGIPVAALALVRKCRGGRLDERRTSRRLCLATTVDRASAAGEHEAVNSPVTPWVLAGRIISIIGMGFTAAAAILLAIVPSVWGAVAGAAFLPFLLMIVLVERYSAKHGLIGPEVAVPED